MPERPTYLKELYPYRAAEPRIDYLEIPTREESAELHALVRKQIGKMIHKKPKRTWERASSIESRAIEKGTEHILRVSQYGPIFGGELVLQEEDQKLLLFEDVVLAFNSIARITQREFTSGTFLSKTEVVIRDFPPDLTNPIVNQYQIEQYRSGIVYGAVDHSRPMLLDRDVQQEARRMTAYDFGALAFDLDRIHAMRVANEPAQGLPSIEFS